MRREDGYYIAFVVAVYVLLLHSFVTAGPYQVVDTEPPPTSPTPPTFWTYSGYGGGVVVGLLNYLIYYLTFIGGYLAFVKFSTVAPCVVGTLGLYFVMRTRGVRGWPLYVLPLLFGFNPYASYIIREGDGPGVLMGMSFLPLVYHFGDRLASRGNLRDFLMLTSTLAIAQFFFYQSFVFSAFVLLPPLLKSRSVKFLGSALTSLGLAFLSELSAELSAYLFAYPAAVPSVVLSAKVRAFSLDVVLLPLFALLLSSLYFLSRRWRRTPEFLYLEVALAFLIGFWLVASRGGVYPPLIGAIVALFTGFSSKVGELAFVLLALALSYVKARPLTAFVFAVLVLGSVTGVAALATFPMSQYEVSHSLYDVAHYLDGRTSGYVGVYYTDWFTSLSNNVQISKELAMANLVPMGVRVTQGGLSAEELGSYGVQYLVTTGEVNEPGLTLQYAAPPYYVYLNRDFRSIAFSASGDPLNITLSPYSIVVWGNSSRAFVLVRYSPFWNGTLPNGTTPLVPTIIGQGTFTVIPMKHGRGVTTFTAAPLMESSLWVDLAVNLGLAVFLAASLRRPLTRSVSAGGANGRTRREKERR
ncbi:hypothetical protein HS1genome_1919 [Sulfodiicoccus acidiphilus]|uniref:Uncharacterized protein n=1 Tax=Sulfodiicoccus acidiphilus TaxID=1670455 RepID=A0A348B5S8_9CREN|nr:hypothetical protein [Sulfodiicoccus acidiphilus]BBD73530.1 hypothetical protein HS1genome_1919 [Sulfodiicoccus acidiphilus]GGT92501.1 hypothetical protein GCM10007116_07810 [Sulfodiicoccus acidiphilus]